MNGRCIQTILQNGGMTASMELRYQDIGYELDILHISDENIT